MTTPLFVSDPYLADATGQVVAHTPEGGVILDRTIFYPTGGGQPGDSGALDWDGGSLKVATALKSEGASIVLVPAEPQALPPIGVHVRQSLDWRRRHGHMRVHTALHLLSVVIPLPVTGGSISEARGRLDFDMPEAPEDITAILSALNTLIARDLSVTDDWITDEDLAANPGLVKTLSVAPPKGAGRVRLVRIGQGRDQVDLQPCGGTHVASTGQIGALRLGKVEKKGRRNRRVYLHLAD